MPCRRLSGQERLNFVLSLAQALRMLVLVVDIDGTHISKWMAMYAPVVMCTVKEQGGAFVGFCTARRFEDEWPASVAHG